MKHLTFNATEEKGQVAAILQSASDPIARFVLAHGAGANMEHQHMQNIADTLAKNNIESLRYNFPFMQAGGRRTDSLSICIETISNALALSRRLSPDLPTFLSGHSFGGRMSSHLVSEKQPVLAGMVYFSYPLHGSKKPDTRRAENLVQIKLPQLFISGTRDLLADLDLLAPIVLKLSNARLHEVETGDHGLTILKRTRQSVEDVYEEVGRIVREFVVENI